MTNKRNREVGPFEIAPVQLQHDDAPFLPVHNLLHIFRFPQPRVAPFFQGAGFSGGSGAPPL